MPELTLSADEARRIALRAQGLLGADGRRGGVPGVLRRLGAVQLDTISVLARSHELVAYARLGPVPRERIEKAYWSPSPARAFEYWSHAACVLPVEEWPWFAFRRRHFRARGIRWHEVPQKACDRVLERLRDEGPLTTKELGGAKRSVEWWDWSDVKIAVEWLLDIGEVVCVERRGWRRVYDLAERALPPEVLGPEPSDEECFTRLAEYHRLKRDQVEAALAESGLVQVDVEGWGNGAWADPDALANPARGRHRTTLLSPFDSLVWDRRRTTRVFSFDHKIEAYVPAPKRRHGYFAMPLLAGGHLVGRVDPRRDGSTLVARQVSLERAALENMAAALREAAEWVGCEAVAVEAVDPPELLKPLRAAIS